MESCPRALFRHVADTVDYRNNHFAAVASDQPALEVLAGIMAFQP